MTNNCLVFFFFDTGEALGHYTTGKSNTSRIIPIIVWSLNLHVNDLMRVICVVHGRI